MFAFVEYDGAVLQVTRKDLAFNAGTGDERTHVTLEDDDGSTSVATLDELAEAGCRVVREVVAFDWIQLADDEWGNDTMREVAEAHFAAHPNLEFVEVHEHAGWFLAYHRSGIVVGTANDMAVFGPEARAILAKARHRKLRTIIRR